jgi:tetratricopeptide (TPR) repeat protein
VALKVLPLAAALDPKQLQRFRHEAQAAAQLHHTHIVPVYAVGCERGVHYYAMQFIDGQSLAAVIRELRQRADREAEPPAGPAHPAGPLAADLTSGRWVPPRPGPADGPPAADAPPAPSSRLADAPTAAHPAAGPSTEPSLRSAAFFRSVAQLGVQAALALEHAHQFGMVHRDVKPANLLLDGRGHLWVTDFGLARLGGEDGLTRSGDLVGTLRYMSPEQVLGRRGLVDQRSDVYSLGLTLYELLTLEPAWPGADRQEILRQIERAEPRPPRALNKAVPRDLETIVLKALAREPAGRYGTAQELADDLRRFLEDRPVRARRPTLAQRATKWAWRHRAVVGVAVPLLLLAVVGLVISNVLIRRERALAEAQRQRAEANYREARDAVDGMLAEVGQWWLADVPQMEPVRRKLLERALAFYEGSLRERGNDPALRWETGRAHRRVGDIRRLLGQHGPAEEAYRAAVEVLAELPARPADRQELAGAHLNLGLLLQQTGRRPEAVEAYRRALALKEELAAEFPAEPAYRLGLAAGYNNLGALLRETGRLKEAEEAYRQALDLQEKLTAAFPAAPTYRRQLAGTHNNLGALLRETGRLREAEKALGRARALREQLADEFPAVPDYRQELATIHNNLGNLLAETGRLKESEKPFRRALALREKLAADSPAVPAYRQELAESVNNLGNLLRQTGQWPGAEEAYRRALGLQEQLAAEFPAVPAYRKELAGGYNNLGALLSETGRRPEAEKPLRQALALWEQLAADFPAVPDYRQFLGSTHYNLGNLLARGGRPKEAQAAYGRALALGEKLAAEFPAVPAHRHRLRLNYHNLGNLLQQTGQLREAIELYGRALRQMPDSAEIQNGLAWLLATCAAPELRDPRRAVELAQKAVARAPQNGPYWNTRGVAQYRAGDWPAAAASLEKSMQLRRGGDAADWFFLAMTCWQSGDKDKARQWYGRAVRWMEKNRPRDEELARFRAEAAALLGLPEVLPVPTKEVPPDK